MTASGPPSAVPTSALGCGADAFVAVRAASMAGFADARATFEYSLVAPTPNHGFFVFAGLEQLLDALERFRTKSDELNWLDAMGVIDRDTRARLEGARFGCDVFAAQEGTIVFPGETVLTVEGPFWQAQLVAALVKSALAEATLAATKLARCKIAAGEAELVESGASEAHRLGGAPILARAGYIGGASATTCIVGARRYGIPVRALMPAGLLRAAPEPAIAYHGWLASGVHGSILRADSRDEIAQAALAARQMRRAETWEEAAVAIEIGGGDRLELAREAVRAFAHAGMEEPAIAVSGGLDEVAIALLHAQSSPINAYFVSADVADDAAALSRYDLVAIEEQGTWAPRMRVGDAWATTSDPGRKLHVRYADAEGRPVADVTHATNERMLRTKDGKYVERTSGLPAKLRGATSSAPLLSAAMRSGKRSVATEHVRAIRDRAQEGLAKLGDSYKRLVAPARYPIGMTQTLAQLKSDLLAKAAGA